MIDFFYFFSYSRQHSVELREMEPIDQYSCDSSQVSSVYSSFDCDEVESEADAFDDLDSIMAWRKESSLNAIRVIPNADLIRALSNTFHRYSEDAAVAIRGNVAIHEEEELTSFEIRQRFSARDDSLQPKRHLRNRSRPRNSSILLFFLP